VKQHPTNEALIGAEALPGAEKRELVQRVVSSPTFAGSPAMRAFLLYIAEHAISGTPEQIKEQLIGSEVLGRRPDYDPSTDNIVRVRAHELRQRLEKHFSTDGAGEPFCILVPKGSYVPEFSARRLPSVAAGAESVSPAPRGPFPTWGPWVLAGALALLVVFLLTRGSTPRVAATQTQPAAIRDLWGQFFRRPDQELMIVTADSSFALWQDLTGRDLDLSDYLNRKYLQMDPPDSKLREIAVRRCTSPADLNLSLRFLELSQSFRGRLNPQYARNISIRDLRDTNAVLIGSRRSNPWVELFEARMNFVLVPARQSGAPVFRNRSPQAGEPDTFAMPGMFDVDVSEQRQVDAYALVAMVPNLSGQGYVLLVEGLTMEGTEAAGETVTNPELLGALLRRIGHKAGAPVRPFEALLKLTSVPGGYANSQVIGFRYAGK
jgi:hypothetical protein